MEERPAGPRDLSSKGPFGQEEAGVSSAGALAGWEGSRWCPSWYPDHVSMGGIFRVALCRHSGF